MKSLNEEICGKSRLYHACKILLFGFYDAAKRHCETIAYLRIAHAALAVELFKKGEGRLPENLDELVPKYLDAVPEDPFDGKPLKYRAGMLDHGNGKLKHGYVVYSVGLDGKDDKAEDCCDYMAKEPKDICFPVLDREQAPAAEGK